MWDVEGNSPSAWEQGWHAQDYKRKIQQTPDYNPSFLCRCRCGWLWGGILTTPHERRLLGNAPRPISSVATIDDSNVTLQIGDDYHWIANRQTALFFFAGTGNLII